VLPPSAAHSTHAADADGDAGERTGGGDPSLRLRGGGLAAEAGDAAERPQLDRLGGDAEAAGGERVTELVEDDREEETERADDRRADADHAAEAGADEHGDQRRAPVHLEVDAAEAAQRERTVVHVNFLSMGA
jgi:hypothetical protein